MGLFWRGLAQAWIDAKSRDLAEQDFGERDGDRPKEKITSCTRQARSAPIAAK
jgi:hypothetical protein